MINQQLLNPESIIVVGGSEDISKPGGKILKNILDGGYRGDLYVLNPKADKIQGVISFRDPVEMPDADLAILAIAAKHCPSTVEFLAKKKKTRAFIIISAGFGDSVSSWGNSISDVGFSSKSKAAGFTGLTDIFALSSSI